MPKSIALCMITSKEDEAKTRSLGETLKPFVDEVVITTNSTDGTADFKWEDDFSAARTDNFSRTKADWILWLDADDELTNPERLRDLIASAEDKKVSHIFLKYQYAFDENGNCIDEHWKANLLKNDGHFKWEGAIHEDPIIVSHCKTSRSEDVIRVHKTDPTRVSDSTARNLRILLKEVEKKPNDPRPLFYLGRVYVGQENYAKAVEVLDKYLTMSGWDDERYEAALLMGQCYFMSGDTDEAIKIYNEAILEKETYPDAYIQKGMAYLKKEEWEKAFYNFKNSLSQKTPEGATYYNPMRYTRDVYVGMAMALMQMGKLDEAKVTIAKAYQLDPKNKECQTVAQLISQLWTKNDLARKYFQIARYLKEENKVRRLLSAVPIELSDNPLILGLRNTFFPPKTWPKKSIAVYCGTTVEPWNPDSMNKGGIGGSETAVIELCKRLAKMGWDITVFNECDAPPEGLVFDGVKYMNYWSFNIKDTFDVLWVWRIPEFFDYELDARLKILDLHDTMVPADLQESRWSKIDKIFVKTKYHRSLFPSIPDDKFTIIGNGIDLARFDIKGIKREPLRFAYTSTPNRGLDILLEHIWPKIKAEIPEATLHTYYGWNTFYKLEKNNPERMAWMKKVQELLKQPGVVEHGRVGQKELAEEMLKTTYWLYPTHFPEIDCITAKEMQAAGVIPITSGFAALAETQLNGIQLPGDVYDPEWQQQYVDTVLKATKEQHGASQVSQFSWDNIAAQWNGELYEAQDNAVKDGNEPT